MKLFLGIIFLFSFVFGDEFTLTQQQYQEIQQNGYTMIRNLENKSGTIVFDIAEDKNIVMQKILNFQHYPQNIEDVSKIEIYEKNAQTIKAHIFIDTFFIGFDNYVIHKIDKKNYKVSWHLDSSKENYFAQMQGYWKLQSIENKTRVFYHNKLSFKSWIPEFIESYLFEKGLFKSTQWIR